MDNNYVDITFPALGTINDLSRIVGSKCRYVDLHYIAYSAGNPQNTAFLLSKSLSSINGQNHTRNSSGHFNSVTRN